jgi:hypothetical protein
MTATLETTSHRTTPDIVHRPRSLSPSQAYTLSPDVILFPVDDGMARLFDLGGKFYAVSAIGARMLRGVLEQGVAATVDQLASEYGIDPARVKADLDAWLGELLRQGLVQCGPARRRGGSWFAGVLAPAFWLVRRRRSLLRRARGLLTLARLCFRLFGWAGTVALWQRWFPKPQRPATQELSLAEAETTIQAVDKAVRSAAAQHFWQMACKERALCCWALLRSGGIDVSLVVGINLHPLSGHCLCEAGSHTLSDYADRCQFFTPVIRYQ